MNMKSTRTIKPTLFLTSNGIVPEIHQNFLRYLKTTPSQTKAVFITTAAYGEPPEKYNGPEPWWLTRDRKTLYDVGINLVEDIDLRDHTKEQLKTLLEGKDIIFVSGGNSFFLLKYARQSGFDI